MLNLLLMRHAESDWDRERETDHARVLTRNGAREARQMATLLKSNGLVPDHILGSNAMRARETAGIIADELVYRGDLCFYEDLYDGSVANYIRRLRAVNNRFATALLVAHNPVVEEFVKAVCAQDVKMGTANIAHMQFDAAAWTALAVEPRGKLTALWQPGANSN
jgi:phosphohistidine phosphatase